MIFERPSWHTDAACRGVDPELFFPDRGGPVDLAKQICAGCPVAVDCLDQAIRNREAFGIWGGMSERQRRKVRGALVAEQKAAGTYRGKRKNMCGTKQGIRRHRLDGEELCKRCESVLPKASCFAQATP